MCIWWKSHKQRDAPVSVGQRLIGFEVWNPKTFHLFEKFLFFISFLKTKVCLHIWDPWLHIKAVNLRPNLTGRVSCKLMRSQMLLLQSGYFIIICFVCFFFFFVFGHWFSQSRNIYVSNVCMKAFRFRSIKTETHLSSAHGHFVSFCLYILPVTAFPLTGTHISICNDESLLICMFVALWWWQIYIWNIIIKGYHKTKLAEQMGFCRDFNEWCSIYIYISELLNETEQKKNTHKT